MLDVRNISIQELNHFNWTLLDNTSAQFSKALSYVQGKYNVSLPMFVNWFSDAYGQHYEVSYLDNQEVFSNAYIIWIPSSGVFADDTYQGISFPIDYDNVPLPSNPQ